jgi:hypothetical protein
MRTTVAALAAFVLVSGATAARAQEEPAPAGSGPRMEDQQADDDEGAPQERPHLQVLQHPYEISSFYRSSQSSGFDTGYEPEMGSDKYPIAGFYRSHGSQGAYSMFWSNGYGTGYGTRGYGTRGMRGRGFMGAAGARPLGLNGDLCLFAPTFLAPAGPLTGVFFEK